MIRPPGISGKLSEASSGPSVPSVTPNNQLEEPRKVLSVPSVIQQTTDDTDDTDSTFQTFPAIEQQISSPSDLSSEDSLPDHDNRDNLFEVVVGPILPRLTLRKHEEVFEYLAATYGRELAEVAQHLKPQLQTNPEGYLELV